MLQNQHSFVIPDGLPVSELVSLLENNFTLRVQPETVSYRVFYDTFDWRLYKKGAALEMYEEGLSRKVYWRAGKKDKLKIQLGLNMVPHLASELSEGEFRQRLQSVASVRELIPRVKVKIKRLPVVMLDNNEKVVVRISFDVYRYSPSKLRASKVLGRRLTIKSVKGYAAYFQQVEALFQDMKLYPAQDNILKLALVAKGVSTGDYTNRLLFLLDPEAGAESALKIILQQLLDIMTQNTSGCIRGRDIEFLHDYSDALNKTCYALIKFHEVFPRTVFAKYAAFFSSVNQLAVAVRDKDVVLLQLQAFSQHQKKSVNKNISLLRDDLVQSREEAQNSLTDILKSPEYRENITHWRAYLRGDETADSSAEKSAEPVYRMADQIIWQLYQQTLEDSNSFADSGDVKMLAELHAQSEKLGYLLEFFRSLYPAAGMHVLINELSSMRDRLGKLRELYECKMAVQSYIKQSNNEKAIKALSKLIKEIEQQLTKVSTESSDIHATFASTYYQDKFREMIVDYHRGQ